MAVIVRGDEFLLCHRHPDREFYPDVWDLPGGHIEDGEPPHDALARELFEELGIRTRPEPEPLVGVQFGEIEAHVWRISVWHGEVINAAPDEHDELRWFRGEDLTALDVADPAVAALCRELVVDD